MSNLAEFNVEASDEYLNVAELAGITFVEGKSYH